MNLNQKYEGMFGMCETGSRNDSHRAPGERVKLYANSLMSRNFRHRLHRPRRKKNYKMFMKCRKYKSAENSKKRGVRERKWIKTVAWLSIKWKSREQKGEKKRETHPPSKIKRSFTSKRPPWDVIINGWAPARKIKTDNRSVSYFQRVNKVLLYCILQLYFPPLRTSVCMPAYSCQTKLHYYRLTTADDFNIDSFTIRILQTSVSVSAFERMTNC